MAPSSRHVAQLGVICMPQHAAIDTRAVRLERGDYLGDLLQQAVDVMLDGTDPRRQGVAPKLRPEQRMNGQPGYRISSYVDAVRH